MDLAALLLADFRGIMVRIAVWAADPRDGGGAGGRFNAIIESITNHAHFVDRALAPLIAQTGEAGEAFARRVAHAHHVVMSLLARLEHAMDHGRNWAIHLGILTEIVCPHLILLDHLLLTALGLEYPADHGDDHGRRRSPGISAPIPEGGTSSDRGHRSPMMRDPSAQHHPLRHGHYPVHHPDRNIPWRMPERSHPASRPGGGAMPGRSQPRCG